nr:MAG TPA: hypothetical protein [Caudoviricetes sp.]
MFSTSFLASSDRTKKSSLVTFCFYELFLYLLCILLIASSVNLFAAIFASASIALGYSYFLLSLFTFATAFFFVEACTPSEYINGA